MESNQNSLMRKDSYLDHFSNSNDSDSSDPADTRPSILITFQNSASYYTSYMGSGGMRGGGGSKRHNFDGYSQQIKEHPIVIMNEYPSPPAVSVPVCTRKLSTCDPVFKAFSGPPIPEGPPKPPGPPMPNVPSSRRESMNTMTLELPKKRRSSASPSITSRNHSPSTSRKSSQCRALVPNNVPKVRAHAGVGCFESSTLPRKMTVRPPRSSHSMPVLTADLENETLILPTPSPRPSVCSSAVPNSQGERHPLMYERRSSSSVEDWTPPNQPKPNWLSLNLDNNRKECRSQSVYVAEIWPSLVCILTAVLMTLIVYILVSYYYYVPHPTTRNRIAPNFPPVPPTQYPYPYPYIPPSYDHYPPYQYPPLPPHTKP